jgi:hypothetical protein
MTDLLHRLSQIDSKKLMELVSAKTQNLIVQKSNFRRPLDIQLLKVLFFLGELFKICCFSCGFCFQGVVVSGERIIYFFVLFGPICVFPVFGQDD